MNTIEDIHKLNFTGFKPIRDLAVDTSVIPAIQGVYIILKQCTQPPEFRAIGSGGRHKGKNPNVDIFTLHENWIDDTDILYIGKVGNGKNKRTLRMRISEYIRFGNGKNVRHWGGRLIWQLENYEDLLVCWLPMDDTANPEDYERELIQHFKITHNGRRPFANLKG